MSLDEKTQYGRQVPQHSVLSTGYPPVTAATKHSPGQMSGHTAGRADALPQRLFAAAGSMFLYLLQSVHTCAYLCGECVVGAPGYLT